MQDDAEANASVTINDQESDGQQIVVESVTMADGGFVTIHDDSVEETALASVLGTSVYLGPGTHTNVTIILARPIEEDQTLVAMPHRDTNDNEVYDFVLSSGEFDGPYTADDGAVTDSAQVTVVEEETETPEEETTTEEEEVETETPEEETTTEEEEVETETPEEETTTEEEEVETETPEEETTTEEEEVETETPEEEEEEVETETPEEEQQFVFKVEEMNIDRWSFVIGDEETPERTETISNVTVTDRRIEINLTEVLQEQQEMAGEQVTTVDPDEADEELSGDVETVRFVIENVRVENVTFVITAPEDAELPPMAPDEVETETPEEEEEEVETETPEEETTTTEEETTTTEEETTTTEEEVETETPEEETTTEEEEVETETPEEEEEVELDSFEVSQLDAPENATVGDTITVSAVVSNPNEQQATQDVAFRLEGTVLARQDVTLGANEQTTVTFEIDTTDVPAGQYIHGVYTQDFGELAIIALEEPTEEEEVETETPEEETTTEEEVETETPEEETTTEEVETTTEA
ncbi:hypothetical protein BRC82_04815 [Halobacteriales archaeon QS_1_67_19]|nr:MAG: hypothetical protein BRC82_04815 [Halobacteriales archaeon QS_1_67_19]